MLMCAPPSRSSDRSASWSLPETHKLPLEPEASSWGFDSEAESFEPGEGPLGESHAEDRRSVRWPWRANHSTHHSTQKHFKDPNDDDKKQRLRYKAALHVIKTKHNSRNQNIKNITENNEFHQKQSLQNQKLFVNKINFKKTKWNVNKWKKKNT